MTSQRIFATCFKMSQSNEHHRLVAAAAQAIQLRHPSMHVTTDLLDAPGDLIPPRIGRHRPDIIARCTAFCRQFVIAEAKTDGDIDNLHTRSQISAFVDHLDTITTGTGIFILAVNGHVAASARTVLRFSCRQRVSSRLHIKLFDGLDFWTLGNLGAPLWRLS